MVHIPFYFHAIRRTTPVFKSKWPSQFLSKYQLALFFLARSIVLVRRCWNAKQPLFGYALACLIELHAVVFGTHPGRVRCRVTISCESPAAPNKEGYLPHLFLRKIVRPMYRLFFYVSNLFREVRSRIFVERNRTRPVECYSVLHSEITRHMSPLYLFV